MKQRSIAKKMTAFCASVVLTATSAGAAFGAYAKDDLELPIVPVSQEDALPSKFDLRNVNGKNYVTPVKMQNPFGTCWAFATAAAAETSYLYINDMGVAAGQVNDKADFSEKYLAYFAYQPITKEDVSGSRIPASQVGEGVYVSDNAAEVLNKLGKQSTGVDVLARFGGPVGENDKVGDETPFAYMGKNKWVTNEQDPSEAQLQAMKGELMANYIEAMSTFSDMSESELTEKFNTDWEDPQKRADIIKNYGNMSGVNSYAAYDDWSIPVDAQHRLAPKIADVKQYKVFDPININSEKPGEEYEFSQEKLDAVKKEIASGHALVSVVLGDSLGGGQDTAGGDDDDDIFSLLGDAYDDMFDDTEEDSSDSQKSYLNTTTWAQYVNEAAEADHAVTIVGYDDNYAKENFARQGEDGEEDPDTIPPENGAFIVKNSWGAVTPEDEAAAEIGEDGEKIYSRIGANDFGIDKSGYYYISYYDQSLDGFVSVDLYKNGEKHAKNANQYDLMTSDGVMPVASQGKDDKMSAASVFTSQQNETLEEISVYAPVEKTEAKYSIYKNFKGSDPTTGELLTSGSKKFDTAGYYRFALDKAYDLKKGDKYAVVFELCCELETDGEMQTRYVVPAPISVSGGTSVVNEGENLLFKNGQWSDYSAELESIKQNIYDGLTKLLPEGMAAMRLPHGKDSVTADNAAIRAYTTPAPQILRFAGSNRFETAAKISQESKLFDSADTVVIANGMDYADALAGVPFAAKLKAPILLTRTDKLSGETAAEIDRLKVKNAVILGGTNAVSEDVEKALKDKGVSVERVFGKTRYSTATQIANKLNEEPEDVFLAYGLDFADALSASAAAAVKGAPIVYINKNGALNADTKAYLESIKGKVKNAYVIGGSAVVSDDVMNQAAQALGIEKAERISGANRYATGAAVNEKFGDVLTGEVICAATGTDFPDALAGGVYAAMNKAALVLVNGKAAVPTLTAEQKDYLYSKNAGTIAVFGGTGAVSDDYAAAVKAAMQAK